MASNLLFIFEGERTEDQILTSLQKYYFNEVTNILVKVAFCNSVYELYDELKSDEDLDTYLILKNKPQNREILDDYSVDDFAEIYLFFDYEYHAPKANDENLLKLLEFFNEETEKGKLYISYPMVESIKHQHSEKEFKDLVIDAVESKNYKRIVSEQTPNEFLDITKYSRDVWNFLIVCHIKKMHYITDSKNTLPDSILTQQQILESQIVNYIEKGGVISILNAFPILVYEYYGLKFIRRIDS